MADVTLRTLANTGDPIALPNGTALASTAVTFTPVDVNRKKVTSLFDAVSGEYIVAGTVTVTTDSNGIFTTPLWPNARGEVATYYRVTVNHAAVAPFYISIPDGVGTISLASARAYAETMTPQETTLIETLIADAAAAVTTAGNSATAASNSASTATTQAGIATAQAGIATDQANIAIAQAATATSNANTAVAQADAASTYAGTASTKADEAAASALSAASSASTASIKADEASASAVSAGVDAGNAEQYAIAADADHVATAADRIAVAADKATVSGYKDTVVADAATVAADKITVAADKATVAADKATVQAITVALSAVTAASSQTLTATQVTSTVIDNIGQAAACDLQLPTAAAGMNFLLMVGEANAYAWRIRAGANDKIYLNGVAGADNGYVGITTPTIGACLAVVSFKTGASAWDWYATVSNGNWTVA